MATVSEQAPRLLDLSQPLDIKLLDSVVLCMLSGSGDEQRLARQILTTLKEDHRAWTRVDCILELSSLEESKYYGLQILEDLIKTRWKTLPREHCESIKNYILGLVGKTSQNDSAHLYMSKINVVLVQILAREWPKNWPSFTSDIVAASWTNVPFCLNTMAIFKLLSEEVFDFSSHNMTQIKAKHLKDTMCSELPQVFQLCQHVLLNSPDEALVGATLETFHRFLRWIPVGYIFEKTLVKTLIGEFLEVPCFLNVTLQCLTEMAGITIGPEYDDEWVEMFAGTMSQLEKLLTLGENIKVAFPTQGDEFQRFIQNMAMFLCTMLKQHGPLLERRGEYYAKKALEYLLLISEVEEAEIFKICLEFWNALVKDLFNYVDKFMNQPGVAGNAGETGTSLDRWVFFQPILSRLRFIIISRMAKPEEVIVVENENGEAVRVFMTDTDSINVYNNMRKALVFLTHLDMRGMEDIMREKLSNQLNESEWSLKNLSFLCWAIGSISGVMHVEDEHRFLDFVLKELLGLCAKKKGKDNKAIINANIMYVVGQYPRFLRDHRMFFRVVVNKLFEFMEEPHPGVKDMACDTLVKIAKKCSGNFVNVYAGEESPFIDDILENTSSHICELDQEQKASFYEAVGIMISAQSDQMTQNSLIDRCMSLPNQDWDVIINQAKENVQVLGKAEKVQELVHILKRNVKVCKALGHPYVSQLRRIYDAMLNVYKVMSENISRAIVIYRKNVTHMRLFKSMRQVKKETLKLMSDWVSKSNDPDLVLYNFILPFLDAVLLDYKHCAIPSAREPEVLSTMATIVNKLGGNATSILPKIFDAVFQPTLDMINKNYEEFPEYRVNFYVMLQAVNQHCFPAFVNLPAAQLKIAFNSIIWAIQQRMRNVADTGLDILYQMLQNVENEATKQDFYKMYYLETLQHVFATVTDGFHTAALKKHAEILAHMFTIVEIGQVTVSLNSAAPVFTSPEENVNYLLRFIGGIFLNAFPHLAPLQVEMTVKGLFQLNQDVQALKEHLRDFLVQIKEFTGEDVSDLYLEERELELRRAQEEKRQVRGILNPHEIAEDMQN